MEDEETRRKLETLLPLAHAEYMAAYEGHRRDNMRRVYESPEFAKGRARNGKPYKINVNSRELRRRVE